MSSFHGGVGEVVAMEPSALGGMVPISPCALNAQVKPFPDMHSLRPCFDHMPLLLITPPSQLVLWRAVAVHHAVTTLGTPPCPLELCHAH